MKYQDYLNSERWRIKREQVLIFWNYCCALCNSDMALDVHHRTYARVGNELLTDLIPLCHTCHERHHGTIEQMRFEFRGYGEMEPNEEKEYEVPF